MGSRFNMFFADELSATINTIQGPAVITSLDMKNVITLKIQLCISKNKKRWLVEAAEEGWAEDEWEFEGYSGDIASGENKLIFSDDEFTVTWEQEQLLQNGNPDWGFPYDDEWFVPIRTLLEKKCEKWGPSLCVKINGRWAIMGFYSD